MASIASVYVDIVPSTAKIADGIARALRDADKDVIAAKKRWQKELGNLKPEVDADTTKAEKKLDKLEREKRTAHIRVEVDQSSLTKARAQLSGGGGGDLGLLSKGNIIGGASTLAALAPNVVPLMGSIVQAAGQLSGVLGLLPAAAGAAGLAIGSLKIGISGFGDAIKASGDPEKFAEALGKLAPNAQQAATAIQGLMPQVTQLKMTVQDALFKGMGDEIGKLGNTYLPVFQGVMGQMAQSANTALTGVSKMLQTPEMQGDIKTFGANAASAFNQLSQALVPVVHAFTDVATVGSSFLPSLAQTVKELADRFAAFIANARETGQLGLWIQGGINAFTQLKDIAVDVWDIFRGLFEAADQGGKGFLDTIEGWTQKFNDFVNSAAGQSQLRDLFTGARQALEAWYPVVQNLMQILPNVFQGAIASGNVWLPILRNLTDLMVRHPGLVTTAAAAYFTWSGIKTVIGTVNTALTLTETLLAARLPAAAATGAAGITAQLAAVSVPAWLAYLVSAGSVASVAHGLSEVHEEGGSPEVTTRYPHLRGPRSGNVGDIGPGPTPPPVAPPENRTSRRPPIPNRTAITPGEYVAPPVAPEPPPTSPYTPPTPATPGDTGSGGGGGATGPLNWDALAQAESGGNWSINTGNGYYGGLQFDQATWDAYKAPGDPARADLASREQQIAAAERLYAKRGDQPWPKNGHLLTDKPGDAMKAPDSAFVSPSQSSSGYSSSGPSLSRVQQATSYAQAQAGKPYEWGGTGPNMFDCSGFISDVYAVLTGQPYQGNERYFTTESNFAALGFKPGYKPGAFNIGVTPGQGRLSHMAAQLPSGVNIEAGGAAGDIVSYGAEATSPLNFAQQYHLDVSSSNGQPTPAYSYDGPGTTPSNPMYTQPTDTGGKQLGKDILAGIGEIFGLGDIFKSPTSFGIFDIFKKMMGIPDKMLDSATFTGTNQSVLGGGSFWGNVLSAFLPSSGEGNGMDTFGAAPEQFIPGLGGGGGGSFLDFASSLVPQGPRGGINNSNNLSVNIGQTRATSSDIWDTVDSYFMPHARQGLRNQPSG